MENSNNPFLNPDVELSEQGFSWGDFGRKIFKGDKVIWSVFIALCVISLVEIFSATSTIVYRQQNIWGPLLRHAMFLIAGVGVILLVHNIPYRFSLLIFVLLGAIILLILTLLLVPVSMVPNVGFHSWALPFSPPSSRKFR